MIEAMQRIIEVTKADLKEKGNMSATFLDRDALSELTGRKTKSKQIEGKWQQVICLGMIALGLHKGII